MRPTLDPARLDRALNTAAQLAGVRRAALIAHTRAPKATRARLALYAALYRTCATSYPELAEALRRDHTTVMSGVRKAVWHATFDADLASWFASIQAAILGPRDAAADALERAAHAYAQQPTPERWRAVEAARRALEAQHADA